MAREFSDSTSKRCKIFTINDSTSLSLLTCTTLFTLVHVQVHFSLGKNQVTCMFPRPYSHCIQELSDGSWYFPVETDEDMEQEGWLYARPIAANE